MISFFPDLNVWLALSVSGHSHCAHAWEWLDMLGGDARLGFSRYTQVGLLRLLTNESVMGAQVKSLGAAWKIYERWLQDPRVAFYPEPRGLDSAFRKATAEFDGKPASKWVGDCYLLAYAQCCDSTLVTFDRRLVEVAHAQKIAAIRPV